jgi:hypothetical protein
LSAATGLKSLGQTRNAASPSAPPLGAEELEGIITEAGKLGDALAVVKFKSRVAAILGPRKPVQSRAMFVELWSFIKANGEKGFDREEARSILLKNLFPRDYALAVKLLEEAAGGTQAEASSLQSLVTGSDPAQRRVAKISSELVEQDAALAAGVFERSLSVSVTPLALSALSKVREKDPGLANYMVAGTLERLKSRPSIVALTGLHLLTAYVFPANAQALGTTATDSSDESLQGRYFSTAHDIFRASLVESRVQLLGEGRYTENDLRFREMYQAQMASVLAAISPRYAPQLAQELNDLAAKMSAGLPPNVAQMNQSVAARLGANGTQGSERPEIAIPGAIVGGDFDEAARLIDKLDNEQLKKAYTQMTAKAQFRSHLSASELFKAMNAARKLDDPAARAFMYTEVAKAANKKGDAALSAEAINEARTSLREVAAGGLRARALLLLAAESLFVSEPDAQEFLRRAINEINALSEVSKESLSARAPYELALAEVNDPRSFIDAPEMQRALSLTGRANLSAALEAAYRIENKAVQLAVRLSASESIFKQHNRPNKASPTVTVGENRH